MSAARPLTLRFATCLLFVWLAVPGCGPRHPAAPAEVPAAAPATTPGDRFDVVIPGNTPVMIVAANRDPDDEWSRAFRYDLVAAAGGAVERAGRRAASEGRLDLPAVPGRAFLYVDAVHRAPDSPAGDEQKSRLTWRRLGDGVWRLFFTDPQTGRRGGMVVTVRLGGRPPASPAQAPPDPEAVAATTAPAATTTAPVATTAPATPAVPLTWGAAELGREVNVSPCDFCGTSDRLVFHRTTYGTYYAIRCDRCGNYVPSQPSPAEAERKWNDAQRRRAAETRPAPGE